MLHGAKNVFCALAVARIVKGRPGTRLRPTPLATKRSLTPKPRMQLHAPAPNLNTMLLRELSNYISV